MIKVEPILLAIPYLVAGPLLDVTDAYTSQAPENFQALLEAGLALFLWPLILLGIDLHIR